MAFDPAQHEVDDKTGFHIHKETGLPVGMGSVAHKPTDFDEKQPVSREYPSWVKVHRGHIVRAEGTGHISVPLFPEFHIDRVTQEISVLVKDAEEEAKASADPHTKKED